MESCKNPVKSKAKKVLPAWNSWSAFMHTLDGFVFTEQLSRPTQGTSPPAQSGSKSPLGHLIRWGVRPIPSRGMTPHPIDRDIDITVQPTISATFSSHILVVPSNYRHPATLGAHQSCKCGTFGGCQMVPRDGMGRMG